jgi:hypothetical protein
MMEETPDMVRDRHIAAVRNVVAGHPQAAVRRIILYTALVVLVGLGALWAPFLILAMAVVVLLATTDQIA